MKPVKILIAEDEALIALLLKRNLELTGYEVCEPVATGEAIPRIVEEEQPDVILMDIRLAGVMNGIEAAREILPSYKGLIIFMSGYSDGGMLEKAATIDSAVYLIKPVTPDDISPIVEKYFNQ
jgi:two-component system, response regulator PdtaR